MGSSIYCTSEVELCIFILDGVLVVALMEGTIAVHYYDLGPVGEARVSRVCLEDTSIGAIVCLWPFARGSELPFASLVTGFESRS